MSENVYEELRSLLDRHPFGCPPGPGVIEMLQVLFSKEEAKLALGLTFAPLKVGVISERASMDLSDTGQRLELLANRGLLFANEKDGVMRYALQPLVVLWESAYWKGEQTEMTEKLSALMDAYGPTGRKSLGGPSASFFRTIPIQEEIAQESSALPCEKLYEIIDRSHIMAIHHCACRESRHDSECHAPREACIYLDAMGEFVINRGFGRPLTREEAKQKIKEFDKAGLVHLATNWQEGVSGICACCDCCCGTLRALKEFGCGNILSRSAFVPARNPDLCKDCRTCADKRCPMDAIEIKAEIHVVNGDRCIGCGLCATGCPNKAILMKRTDEVPAPPIDAQEWGFKVLTDHGRLEKFMELMTHREKT